jgi:hypothetical protein
MRVRAKDKSDQAGNPASELHFQLNSCPGYLPEAPPEAH